eukprot:3884106-Rhodomonas_salina.1
MLITLLTWFAEHNLRSGPVGRVDEGLDMGHLMLPGDLSSKVALNRFPGLRRPPNYVDGSSVMRAGTTSAALAKLAAQQASVPAVVDVHHNV